MATVEGAGWGEGLAEPGLDGMVGDGLEAMGSEVIRSPLGFSASMAVEAALVQDESADAELRAARDEAGIRHFGEKDPRDLL
jgi:hypothetical protein